MIYNKPNIMLTKGARFAVAMLLALVVVGLTGGIASANTAGKKQEQVYTVRYICFVATPRVEGLFSAKDTPPALRGLKTGSDITLDPTPQAFLNKLTAADTRLQYRLVFAGRTVYAEGAAEAAAIETPLNPNDPFAIAVSEQVQVSSSEENGVMLQRTGELLRKTPKDQGQETVRWKNAKRKNVVLGRTYSHFTTILPSGERLVYAYCVIAGNR